MARLFTTVLTLTGLALVPSCSTTFHPRACNTDDDCGGGLVCVQETTGDPVCKTAASAPLKIGMSAPITGPSQDLGTEMKKGMQLAIDAQNAAGGVRGRPIQLDFRDDEYQPDSAEQAARDLLEVTPQNSPAKCPTTTVPVVAGNSPVASTALSRGPEAVLGLVGNVGTPTMVRTAPIAVETGSLFFGAFTGASKVLRDGMPGPCAKYIFNVRASYAQEARATVEYFVKLGVPDSRHFVSFDQNDSFGQAGYDGLVAAYTAVKGPITSPYSSDSPIARFRYNRGDETSVPAQVAAITQYLGGILNSDSSTHTVGIFMTDTYGAATELILGVRNWQYANDSEQSTNHKATRLTLYFSNVSFVGPNSLASRLKDAGTVQTPSGAKPFSDGVFVSQVVPNYESDNSDAVNEYRQALAKANLPPSFTSLEGYLVARIFVAGLVAHEGPFTPDALVGTFEHLPPLNLGLGGQSGFAPGNHNYSKAVFGTSIAPDGTFTNIYYWSDGNPIQLFE